MSVEEAEPLIEYFKTVETPTLCNAIELLGVRPHQEGYTPSHVRCLFPDLGRLCGYAVTAHVETVTTMGPRDKGEFMKLYRAVARGPKPVVVAFQEVGGHPDYAAAHCGEIIATITQRLGAVGLVTDGAVRDLSEVRGLGFQYFSRGASASHGNLRIVRVGVPIQIMGMTIKPGDLLHGDENGLALVPEEKREQIKLMVDQVRRRERKMLELARSPDFSLEALRGFYA